MAPKPARPAGIIENFLRSARTHLGLQVAYVSQIIGNEVVYHHVDAPGMEALIKPGDVRCLDDVYCRHILEGRLPELIPDTAAEPLALAMPITAAVPIGAHVSVPLRLADGSLFGMFCCLGPAADSSLNPRDLAMMRTFADMAAQEISREKTVAAEQDAIAAPVRTVLAARALSIQLQPIWRVGQARPLGFEALARIAAEPARSPDRWFADAAQVGLGAELELLAVEQALVLLAQLPAPIYLTINVSPAVALLPALHQMLSAHDLSRIVLEITEHDSVADFSELRSVLSGLRAAGMRLAVDDAGAGYSGLQQILQLQPDIIKLDRFFVNGIDNDPARRALAAALASFAARVGSVIVAEGVEHEAELTTLRSLGFRTIQGYLLGKPTGLEAALALLD